MRTTRQSVANGKARVMDNNRTEDISKDEERSNSDNESVHCSDEEFIASSDEVYDNASDDEVIDVWPEPLRNDDDLASQFHDLEDDDKVSNGQSINGPMKKRRVTKTNGTEIRIRPNKINDSINIDKQPGDDCFPINGFSITISKLKGDVSHELLNVIGNWIKSHCVKGVVSTEVGKRAFNLHLQSL